MEILLLVIVIVYVVMGSIHYVECEEKLEKWDEDKKKRLDEEIKQMRQEQEQISRTRTDFKRKEKS